MSDTTSNEQARKPLRDYAVGYKRPPKAHQFKKGVSGNPKGRPGKRSNERLYEEEVKRLAHQEAYRPIAVREGDEVVYVSGIQAALRMMLTLGLRGNTRMLHEYVKFVCQIETERREEMFEMMMAATDYKEHARKAREEAKRENKAPPEFVPKPDDIQIDTENGGVRCTGPVTLEQKQKLDRLRELKRAIGAAIAELHTLLKETPNDPELLKELADAETLLKTLIVAET